MSSTGTKVAYEALPTKQPHCHGNDEEQCRREYGKETYICGLVLYVYLVGKFAVLLDVVIEFAIGISRFGEGLHLLNTANIFHNTSINSA